MTTGAIDALHADREAILKIGAGLTGAVRISVTGPGARTLRLGPGDPVAEISSGAPAFIRWVTQRGSWAELGVRAHGDERQLRVAAGLKVF